jgi:hypothetical protein|tara:strand:+ start:393 stop:623 length:231 start_codon:yes stop_codon:yes gene_type:complete
MSEIKLQKKELQELKELRDKGNNLIFSLGNLVIQQFDLYSQFVEIREDQNKVGKELQEKYGEGNIDLDTGKFTKSE